MSQMEGMLENAEPGDHRLSYLQELLLCAGTEGMEQQAEVPCH